ncbi:MAG: hypothetical protein WCD49_01990, partial [Candidatus Acidiferrales bacterium]
VGGARAFRPAAKRCAACSARTAWARPENAVLPPIVSTACVPRGSAELVQLEGSAHDCREGRARDSPLWACRTTPPVPLAFDGDKSGVFVRHDEHWTVEEQLAGKRQPTQFGRALEQLGATFIAANSPQANGRVERLWGVLQDRLTSELRLAKAADIDSAIAILRKFISDYNLAPSSGKSQT